MTAAPPDAPESHPAPRAPRDAANWAKGVSIFSVAHVPEGAVAINVDGRRILSPIEGFGQMWQKTYRVSLDGAGVSPAEVIVSWKENFPAFWPPNSRFHAPLAGIIPGEIALLDSSMPGRMRLSTGVMVLYADEESFTLMTPEGHVFGGWVTFSAFVDEGQTIAQAQVLMRASDPLFELGLLLGGHRQEDRLWQQTLASLAAFFGLSRTVETQAICIDRSRQWSRIGNLRRNAAVRSLAYQLRGSALTAARLAASALDRGRGGRSRR